MTTTAAVARFEQVRPSGVVCGDAPKRAAREHRVQLFAITPVIAERWRGRSDLRERIKLAVAVVPFPAKAAECAGVVLGKIRGDQERARIAIDVMVMAFAATYGGALVYTSDIADLQRIAVHFPEVRLLGV